MKKILLFNLLVTFAVSAMPLIAEEAASSSKTDNSKTPWLEGVELEPVPKYITPVIPLKLYLKSGEKIPKVLTEDEPIEIQADSDIFFDNPPTKDRKMVIPNPEWEGKPCVNWRIINWETNKTTKCLSTPGQSPNCMVVVPVTPTRKGALYCDVGRKMSYDTESGDRKKTFANSSGAKDVRVKDITPPTCGLEISVVNGSSGSIYPVENPPNHFPLPKTADLVIKGSLFNKGNDPDYEEVVSGVVLGLDMIAPEEQGTITVGRGDVIKITVTGSDNYKLDTNKVKYGICAGAGGEPTPVCQENQPEYDLAGIKLPQNPYFYLDASDTTGNREVLFVPIKVKY